MTKYHIALVYIQENVQIESIWVKPEIELTEIELTEIELTELMEWDLVDKEENENIKINIGN